MAAAASSSSSSSVSPSSSSSSLFDDSDWELADDVDAGGIGDEEWVITGDDEFYVPGRSMSGVYVPIKSFPAFVSFHPKTTSSSSSRPDRPVPPPYSVSSSSNGLILCRGPWSSYCVCNPSTGAHHILPKPLRPHRPRAPAAIVISGPAYHVICAVAGAGTGSYSFSVFSSRAGCWRSSEVEFALAGITPNTGVSCGGLAYWRTETQMLAEYDVKTDRARILAPPVPVKPSEAANGWQLGRAGERLCCAVVTGSDLQVYALGAKGRWTLLCSVGIVVSEEEEWDGGEPIVCRRLPRPLRFDSHEPEVLLMVDGKLVVLGLGNRKMRTVRFERPAPDRYDEYVPYVDDPLASVDPLVATVSVT